MAIELTKELLDKFDSDEPLTDEEIDALVADVQEKQQSLVSSGLHCVRCGAGPKDTKLGFYMGGKRVDTPEEGSKVECIEWGPCQKRLSDKWVKGDNSVSGKHGTSAVQTTFVEKCRHEAHAVFYLGEGADKVTFYGGSKSKVEGALFDPKQWAVISLLGSSKDLIWCANPSWMNVLKPYASGPTMSIDWPDYGAPPLKPGFWTQLLAIARKAELPKVLFYCFGGHGRTGKALAAVLVEQASMSPSEAVTFVRKHYCKEAVESQSQIDYLKMLYEVGASQEAPPPSKVTKKKG